MRILPPWADREHWMRRCTWHCSMRDGLNGYRVEATGVRAMQDTNRWVFRYSRGDIDLPTLSIGQATHMLYWLECGRTTRSTRPAYRVGALPQRFYLSCMGTAKAASDGLSPVG